MKRLFVLLGIPLELIIRIYQKTLSPDHGILKYVYSQGYCRFYPSCSQYALEGLRNKGLLALPKILLRLMRCSPWSLGGIDHFHQESKK